MTSEGPLVEPSIPATLAAAATRWGDRTAIREGATSLSYRALQAEARKFAAALISAGLEPGDRVAVWSCNSIRWVVAALGTLCAGAVLVPLSTRLKGAEAVELLQRSRAGVLVTVTDFLGNDYVSMLDASLAAIGTELPHLREIVVAAGPATGRSREWPDLLGGVTAGSVAEADRRAATLGPEDTSDILFTSGTTGVPKGVVMTHGRTLCVAGDWVAMTGLTTADTYLMVNPYFHMFGLKAGILASIVAGATMLPEPVFDVDRVLTRVASEHVTVLPGPPTLYHSILDHPGRAHHDLSTLRVAVTGAADIPVELIRRMHDELPMSRIVTGYGLTEAGTAAATGPEDDVEAIAHTVGRARPGFEIRTVDDSRNDVERGSVGEVLVRGGSVMAGYLDDPQATADVLSPDGWLRTGDLGSFDAADRLSIVGRVKDMFIVGGFNAYPAEIEDALLRHPVIREAAVIGVPDQRLGQVGMAFLVVLAPVTGEEIIAWCRDQMANYKVPRAVEIVDRLPVNASGKVEKQALQARVTAGPEAGRAAAPRPEPR